MVIDDLYFFALIVRKRIVKRVTEYWVCGEEQNQKRAEFIEMKLFHDG